jgi:hypothetical protein
MRERWMPITRNTKRLFMINFSLKHQNQHLNQKTNVQDDTKRGAEMRHADENEKMT